MARVSKKVYEWQPKKGKGKCAMDIYYATEANKDTLFNIHLTHKKWGKKWYELVIHKMYDNAKLALITEKEADGFCFLVAIKCIEDLAQLEEELKAYDKKEER